MPNHLEQYFRPPPADPPQPPAQPRPIRSDLSHSFVPTTPFIILLAHIFLRPLNEQIYVTLSHA